MLTKKQHELLAFIQSRLAKNGVSPSFDEMKDALNLKSKSGIHRLITGLEERGFIRRLPHRARALEILKLPDAVIPMEKAAGSRSGTFSPSVIRPNFGDRPAVTPPRPADEATGESTGEAVSLPLYGKIAAGTPIEALRDHSNTVDVPGALLSRGEHYALTVEGDSMIGAGIHDGDTVIIERCSTADNGSIVVALIDEEEVTLKRLRKKGNSVALEAANEAYETRIFGPDRVKLQGKLVGLLRTY
jgi:repressor LexA